MKQRPLLSLFILVAFFTGIVVWNPSTEATVSLRDISVPLHTGFPVQQTQEATILFTGDMMFDRSVRVAGEKYGGDYLLECVDSVLKTPDLVVANLEGPITATTSRSVGSVVDTPDNYTFTFPTGTAKLLARHNIFIVNLGNNHILNFGTEGETETKRWLAEAGVDYFGDTLQQTVAYKEVQGVPLAFINYNDFTPLSSIGSASTTREQIVDAKMKGYLPVVYTHWGTEYRATSTPRVQNLAHSFVDAGAALIIGSHPHVIEEREAYKGVYIYYSLGNFVFDQYFSPEVQQGLLVRATFSKKGVTKVEDIPVTLTPDRRVCPASSVE